MSKLVIVPEEIRRKLVAEYTAGGKSLKEVGKLYGFGYDVMRRIMAEENIEIKVRKSNHQRIFSSEEIKNIIEDYVDNKLPLCAISKKNHTADYLIKRLLVDNNIPIRTKEENSILFNENRKYKVNDNYFSVLTPDSAWLIGFLAADGYLPKNKNTIIIDLQRKDKEILDKIKIAIGFTGEVKEYLDHGYEKASLSFASRQMRIDLEKYGVVNNKTDKVFFPKELMPKELLIHFLRGYWDGDGSIYEPSDAHKISMNLISINKTFIEDVNAFLEQVYNIPAVTIHERRDFNSTRPLYCITYRTTSSFQLGSLFYNNDYLGLKRKKDKYKSICEKYQHSL